VSSNKKWREEETSEAIEWLTILVLISLLLSIGLSNKIRTFHVPTALPLLDLLSDRLTTASAFASFTFDKWRVRIEGGDASQMVFNPSEEEAKPEVAGLPINNFCDPPGEAPLIEYIDLLKEIEDVENGASPKITAHCKDDTGREIIQVRDHDGDLPVYHINRSPTKGKIEFLKLE
jgi:hypothetical protein